VMAFHVGDRSRKSAKRLWAKIPEAYRQYAMFYTDQYVVYQGVIPAAQHRAISKLARQTNHLERFNNTLRQRVSRLVRQTLSFSKKLSNHIGAIKFFHIPSDLVVDRGASSVRGSLILVFPCTPYPRPRHFT
jgi:insertion element IS1 protein InsB